MPQQINLHTTDLSTQRRPFSALFMVQAMAVLVVLGVAFGLYEVTSLNRESAASSQTLRTGQKVLDGVRPYGKDRPRQCPPNWRWSRN